MTANRDLTTANHLHIQTAPESLSQRERENVGGVRLRRTLINSPLMMLEWLASLRLFNGSTESRPTGWPRPGKARPLGPPVPYRGHRL